MIKYKWNICISLTFCVSNIVWLRKFLTTDWLNGLKGVYICCEIQEGCFCVCCSDTVEIFTVNNKVITEINIYQCFGEITIMGSRWKASKCG